MKEMECDKAKKQEESYMASAGVMLAFLIFAFCAVAMLLYSAAFCQKISQSGEQAWERRTCGQYLEWKIQQMDEAGCISTGTLGGEDALVLTESIEGEDYSTWIYCSSGWMREYFAESSGTPDPDAGTEILEANQMHISQDGNLLTIKADLSDGTQVCADICMHSGGEERE
ncbi:MAG: DUF4860 domain-containing protein [Firmicutes bacterium]|nr:DUF4860 domain-containing protein [Bacillota bacterium]